MDGQVVEREDPGEAAVATDDGQPTDLALRHGGERARAVVVLSARPDGTPDEGGEPEVREVLAPDLGGHQEVAVRHDAADASRIEDGDESAVAVPHDPRGVRRRILDRARRDVARHQLGDFHRAALRSIAYRSSRQLQRSTEVLGSSDATARAGGTRSPTALVGDDLPR